MSVLLPVRDRMRPARQDDAVYGVVLPVVLYLVTVLGFVPDADYRPAAFFDQYSHGIYRYRFLARELIAGTAALIGHVAGHAVSPSAALFVAFLVVGSASVAGLGLVLYRVTAARRPDALGAYLVLMAVLVLGTYAVTPYDLPSYLLIALTCLAAVGPRPRSAPVCFLAAGVAACTRESAFLAAAASVAVCWSSLDRPRSWRGVVALVRGAGPDAARWRNAAAVCGATAVTYAALRVVLASNAPVSLWAGPGVASNLHDIRDLAGVLMAVGLAAVLWHGYARTGCDGPAAAAVATARRGLWLLAVPYLVVSTVGGIWSEAPRLLAPVLLCEYLVVTTHPARRATAGSD